MRTVLLHLLLVALAAVVLAPTAWLACASFKTQQDVFDYAFLPWDRPGRLTLGNFRTLFDRTPFGRWLFNSLFLASAQTVAVVTLSSLGGFALAKYRFPGRKPLMGVMLATMLLPWQVLLPANAELMSQLRWINSYAAAIGWMLVLIVLVIALLQLKLTRAGESA